MRRVRWLVGPWWILVLLAAACEEDTGKREQDLGAHPPRDAVSSPGDARGEHRLDAPIGATPVWHPITLDFKGPASNESAGDPNPFLYYRLQVSFSGPGGQIVDVPGFFDGDGRGGASGDVWRVRFAPDVPGSWSYVASFHEGEDVAISTSPAAGSPMSFDGQHGTFLVAARDAGAPGFLSSGRLVYADGHYLKTLGDGRYWIKGGTDSPENFLAYAGFDQTTGSHSYSAHLQHWKEGDPDWSEGSGRGIIGALNYLASRHVNAIYFLPMNIGGDGQDVWPYAGAVDPAGSTGNDNEHFDLSKLAQWNTVFEHAQRKGILLHFVLCEAEQMNKRELDDGELGRERKLFYRELIARFGHINALQWNLCEEWDLGYDPGAENVRSWAGYIKAVDPYDHPRTIHNGKTPEFVIGDSNFELTSTQYHPGPPQNIGATPYGDLVEEYRAKAEQCGRKIPVCIDEGWSTSDVDDESTQGYGWTQICGQSFQRKHLIWPIYLSGGQTELILKLTQELAVIEDFSPYEHAWDYLWYARRFVEGLPFWEMQPADDLLTGERSGEYEDGQVLAKPGEVYALYLPDASEGGTLLVEAGGYTLRWYNPRTGTFEGASRSVSGPAVTIGAPPSSPEQDWAVLLQR